MKQKLFLQAAVWLLLKRGVLGDDELIKVVCGMMRSHLVYEGPSSTYERVHPRHSRFPTGSAAAAHISRQAGERRARADIWAFFNLLPRLTAEGEAWGKLWPKPPLRIFKTGLTTDI